jgi:predicted DNA-binding ribbon-helix-helix protein
VALEAPFWDALERLAARERRSLSSLVAEVDRARLSESPPPGLASALRVYALWRLSAGEG